MTPEPDPAAAPRYAIYFAPAVDSPWWRFGAGWLGWDERRSTALTQPSLTDVSAQELHALTTEPRRYGFHATLKAPFRLHAQVTEQDLCSRLAEMARRLRAVPLGPMAPALLEDFVALLPRRQHPSASTLAAVCVLELEPLRAPLTLQELARRRPDRLDAVGNALLRRFGYPHVLDRFRFHMTLSGPVEADTAARLIQQAQLMVQPLNARHPLVLDRLCLFREDHPGAPFVRIDEQVLAT